MAEETIRELFSGSIGEVEDCAQALTAEALGPAKKNTLRRVRSRALDVQHAAQQLAAKLKEAEDLV